MRSFRKLVAQLGVIALAAAGTLAVTSPARAATVMSVINKNSKMCLAIGHSSVANRAKAIQWPCGYNSNQYWEFDLLDGAEATFTIMNRASDKCLAIGDADTTNGAPAIQWTCAEWKTEQQWVYDSWYRLRNKATDRCLAIPGSSREEGTTAIQWTCNANLDQRWGLD